MNLTQSPSLCGGLNHLMNIQLPPILCENLDLTQINQQLRQGEGKLDWSGVISAPLAALQILLRDIPQNHPGWGLDENPPADYIVDQILKYYNQAPDSPPETPTRETQKTARVKKSDSHSPPPEVNPPAKKFPNAPSQAEIRAELEDLVLKDLLGPAGGEEEEIEESRVTERYLVGVLAPQLRDFRSETDCQDEMAIASQDDPEEGKTESNPPTADGMLPSSIGLSFCVSAGAQALEITVSWGKYDRQPSDSLQTDQGNPKTVWKRCPMRATVVQNLKPGAIEPFAPLPQEPSVLLQGSIKSWADGDWIVTLFLVNAQQEPSKNKDSAWLFQPEIKVRSADGAPIFGKKPLPQKHSALDPVIEAENQTMAMLYRHQVEFAVGHGVGVHAETVPNQPNQATCLVTRVVPTYEVPATEPPRATEVPELAGLVLDMEQLARETELRGLLEPLTTAYGVWIEKQTQRLEDPTEDLSAYRQVAQNNLSHCRHILDRIEEGIKTLETNPQAAEAFRFMNEAMRLQRIHQLYSAAQRRGENTTLEAIDIPANRSWYPFQLAFILLNIPSTTDLHHPARSHPTEAIADLLWFPTGGGKTEAYLGLTAFTIALRRLQGTIGGRDGEHGVAVLMRYTLRLLTLQQFQRATTLICACEVIRRTDEAKWGKEPFRIGLWVGMKNTPNKTADSEEAIRHYLESRPCGSGSPHQLTNCPWCGSEIDPKRDIKVESFKKGRGRTFIMCSDRLGRCPFSKGEGLPVLVVDEEIYRRLPTLLIATVDKFAQMPWKGEVQMLFGQVSGYCERHGFRSADLEDSDRHNSIKGKFPAAKTLPHPKLRPPDLIIQDELHLISGPLGTMVGLYETAVDQLCTWFVDGQAVRPKAIASTATIRQAQTQVHNLFLRKLSVFPPPRFRHWGQLLLPSAKH